MQKSDLSSVLQSQNKTKKMLSAIKKLTSKAEHGTPLAPSGGTTMSGSLQKKFAKGVQYNSSYYILF